MALQVKIVVGNPTPASRTRHVAELFVDTLLARGETARGETAQGATAQVEVIELSEYATELFDFASERVSAVNAAVAASDLVVFATPTYKATYTGLLKAFLDRYGTNGLAGVVAIPVQTGGSPAHSLAVIQTLAPLLLELGATIPGRGLYMPMDREPELDALVTAAATECLDNFRRLAAVAGALPAAR